MKHCAACADAPAATVGYCASAHWRGRTRKNFLIACGARKTGLASARPYPNNSFSEEISTGQESDARRVPRPPACLIAAPLHSSPAVSRLRPRRKARWGSVGRHNRQFCWHQHGSRRKRRLSPNQALHPNSTGNESRTTQLFDKYPPEALEACASDRTKQNR